MSRYNVVEIVNNAMWEVRGTFKVTVEQIAPVFAQQNAEVLVDAFVQLRFMRFFDRKMDKGKQIATQRYNCFLHQPERRTSLRWGGGASPAGRSR